MAIQPRKALSTVTLKFSDPQIMRLVEQVNAMTVEIQRLQAMADGGREGQILTKQSSADYDATWVNP